MVEAKCWGSNNNGQLGYGLAGVSGISESAINLGTDLTATQISAGDGFTCVLLSDSSVKCFGDNENGALGLGSSSSKIYATGDDLPKLVMPGGHGVTKIKASSMNTCALLETAELVCWGMNYLGGLGRDEEFRELNSSSSAVAIDFGAGRTVVDFDLGFQNGCGSLIMAHSSVGAITSMVA